VEREEGMIKGHIALLPHHLLNKKDRSHGGGVVSCRIYVIEHMSSSGAPRRDIPEPNFCFPIEFSTLTVR